MLPACEMGVGDADTFFHRGDFHFGEASSVLARIELQELFRGGGVRPDGTGKCEASCAQDGNADEAFHAALRFQRAILHAGGGEKQRGYREFIETIGRLLP